MVMKNKMETTKEKQEGNNVEKSGMDLDTILVEIGQFDRYQFKMLALLSLATIFCAFASTEYIFTTARIQKRCLIPECDNVEGQVEFNPSWILNAVPAVAGGSFDNCQRFANFSGDYVSDGDDICPAILFNQTAVVACDQYVYENENTVVYTYDMACNDWQRTMIGSFRAMGNVVALPLTGYISDTWGRRTALIVNIFNTAWLGLARYWANNYIGFVISEISEGIWGGGFSCCYIMMMEFVSSKYRTAAGATISSSFAVGQVLVGIIAWTVPYWRHLILTLYTPQLITISYIWLVSETVRWYLSKGRYTEAEKVLKEIAQVNGKQLSETSLLALKQSAEDEKKQQELEKELKSAEPWLLFIVFRHKAILLRCIVSPVWWITTTLVVYGMTVNSVNISGNMYIDFCAVAAIEIPGFWTAFILMSKIGRKPVLMGAYWICACCQLAYLFMPDGNYGLALTIYLIGKFTISMVVVLVYVYTAELYPTMYRHRLFAFSSMIGRFGSIIAPLTPAFGDKVPFILFGGCALLSGGLVLLTPETLGSKLPDTMEEAAQLGKKKVNSC